MTVESGRAYDADTRQARAERILDAAAELLQRWGYKRLTMDDVAVQAGIGKGTIYLHYKNRDALFDAVLQRELAALFVELADRVRQDPINALPHKLGRLYFLSIMQRPLLRALFTFNLEVLGKLAHSQRMRDTRIDHLRIEFMRLLVNQQVVRADIPPAELAYAFRTVLVGFFLAEPIQEGQQPSLERKADLLEMTLRGAFALDRTPSEEAVQAVASHVLELFAQVSGEGLADFSVLGG